MEGRFVRQPGGEAKPRGAGFARFAGIWAAPAPFFRFPYLQDPKEQVDYLGKRNIAIFSHDVDSFDFKIRKPEDIVKSVMSKLDKKGKPVIEYQNVRVNSDLNCPADAAGLDIGPATVQAYSQVIAGARTILWNGPMGLFENKQFAAGTNAIARAVADATQQRGAKSIIGGGDSVKALNKAGLGNQVTFMSTGGGASLEFLEGAVLPGVAALTDK